MRGVLMDRFRKPLYMAAGFTALLLGAIGVVLPLLPTTPFVILAAFFFSKGSKRVHLWLLSQKTFGPMIQAWEQDRVIPYKAKLLSTTMMLTMVSYPLIFRPFALWLKVMVVFTVFYALWYVWRHRSEPVDTTVEKVWQRQQMQLSESREGQPDSPPDSATKSHRQPIHYAFTQEKHRPIKRPAPLGWKPAHVIAMQPAD